MMNKVNLLNDLSRLTTIPETSLNHLSRISLACISHAIIEAKLNKETECSINIGIGDICIVFDEEEINIRFEPSKNLETVMKDSINDNKDYLTENLESILNYKVMKAYKELV